MPPESCLLIHRCLPREEEEEEEGARFSARRLNKIRWNNARKRETTSGILRASRSYPLASSAGLPFGGMYVRHDVVEPVVRDEVGDLQALRDDRVKEPREEGAFG